MAIPARFRDPFKPGLVLSRGLDRCIWVYTLEGWRRFNSRLEELSPFQEAARRVQRAIYAGAFEAELDRQGRVLVPSPLRAYAGITQGVVILGMNDHLELWGSELWATEHATLENETPQIAERLHG